MVEGIVDLNADNYESEVVKADTPVIIDFWAEWCGPCKMMAPIFHEMSKEYHGKLKFVKLNTEENQEIPSKFGIQGIPTLVVVSKGKEIDRIVGFAPKSVLKSKIDQILGKVIVSEK